MFDNGYGRRNRSYRESFIRNHEPDAFGRYRCVYCGKLMRREDLTVDHLYPVGEASASIRLQERLKAKGLSGVNDQKNLVAACPCCNRKKGNRMGLWILKGKLGRLTWYWPARKLLRCSAVILLAGTLYIWGRDPGAAVSALSSVNTAGVFWAIQEVMVHMAHLFRM